jgi:hypothetical protein
LQQGPDPAADSVDVVGGDDHVFSADIG